MVGKPEDVGFSSERLQRLDALMQGFIEKKMAPNAVAFVARHGKIVYYKAFGYSNVEKKTPLQKDAIYRIASQTKALTTIALMMLYEEGKFWLDEPVADFIPAFQKPDVLVSYDEKDQTKYVVRPAKKAITIRHLLTHTAGISYEHPLQELPAFKVPFFNSLDNVTLAEVVPKIAARPLLHEPGEQFTYGLSSDVLGYLVELLSGMPLDTFFQKRILTPLGMTDTYFYLPPEKSSRLVELYAKKMPEGPMTVSDNNNYRKFAVAGAQTYLSGGAGLVGTISDYARICQLLLNNGEFNGKRLLSPATVQLMTQNQIGNLEVWDRKDAFGLGFQVATAQTTYLDPTAPGTYMWGGMYGSEYTIDPKKDMILLVYTNVIPYTHYTEFVRKFRVVVYQALVE